MMIFYDWFLIPILFGLVGFIEPCSLGINVIFLNRMQAMKRKKRIREAIIFTFVRGFILAMVGLTAAFVGSRLIKIQFSLFIVLGAIYILAGILAIINMYRPIFQKSVNFAKHIKNRGAFSLGIIFGLVIPACAIAFIIVLVGKAIVIGDLLGGFISLLVFGITLSSPLIFISYSEKSIKIIKNIGAKTKKIPWLGGTILIIIGILTLLTSIWWKGALL